MSDYVNRLILKVTARRWNRLISAVLCRAYSHGVINSTQLHVLAHEFDPTQSGIVGNLPRRVEPGFARRSEPKPAA
jgi:hypothetical protein